MWLLDNQSEYSLCHCRVDINKRLHGIHRRVWHADKSEISGHKKELNAISGYLTLIVLEPTPTLSQKALQEFYTTLDKCGLGERRTTCLRQPSADHTGLVLIQYMVFAEGGHRSIRVDCMLISFGQFPSISRQCGDLRSQAFMISFTGLTRTAIVPLVCRRCFMPSQQQWTHTRCLTMLNQRERKKTYMC